MNLSRVLPYALLLPVERCEMFTTQRYDASDDICKRLSTTAHVSHNLLSLAYNLPGVLQCVDHEEFSSPLELPGLEQIGLNLV